MLSSVHTKQAWNSIGRALVESHGSEAGTAAKALCSFDALFYLAALIARVQFGKSFYPHVFVSSMFDGLLWYIKF